MNHRPLLFAFLLGWTAWSAGADAPRSAADFAGTYFASLPERSEILQIHRDGTAQMTLSDQVTAGAGGFTFSDSLGSWKIVGGRHLRARFMNLNFDITGLPAYTGAAVVDYDLRFAPGLDTFTASCRGRIFATGDNPFDPASTPVVEFDCAYLDGFRYQRVPLD